ncbi:MAG: 2Fe-2S iron-sulfur cluster binding domain-containing protein [Oxalobacteraceae bacterium]|nr:MAG: 2Fe-2S iron-sulfur cluster binding domain-containing protein [Oxalobacteraceae bacterium]
MPIIRLSNGSQFESEPKESVLDAAMRAGVTVSYSCRTGRCSSCKAKVQSGASVPLQEELGLSQEEKSAGWMLSCVRTAESDLALEVEDLGDVVLPAPKTLPCRIHALERLAPDVLRVVLRLPPSAMFTYYPGQYVDVLGPGGVRRSYSIANASADHKLLELHIRQVAGGVMSEYWFAQAKENDLLRLHGPLGTFFLRDIAGKDLVFLATGTGIAPVKAMLESFAGFAEQDRPRSVSVYWGGRTPADLYWDVAGAAGGHRYVPVLSRAQDGWPGARGYVQQALLSDTNDFSSVVAYACGSNTMIQDARRALLQAGLPERRFHSDAFVCSADGAN